jgi:peptidoglycan hydrolase CwlO-like protein
MPEVEMIKMMSIFIMMIGSIVLVIGFVFVKEKEDTSDVGVSDEWIYTKRELQTMMNEADDLLKELNDISSYIMDEIDKKHKDLLFLYQLIEEKQKDLVETTKEKTTEDHHKIADSSVRFQKDEKHMYSNKIFQLYEEGKDIAAIAKELNIGKGEVELVLELTKMR